MLKKFDAILVDDDAWVRDHWSEQFTKSGKSLCVYQTPNSFITSLKEHAKDIPIFIDYRFKNLHRNGSEIAFLALKKGFKKLFITSNLTAGEIDLPEFISELTDKNPPTWILEKNHALVDLSLEDKRQLLASMTPAQKEIFHSRMNELYEIKFGSSNAFIDVLQFHDNQTLKAWEKAIYLSLCDEDFNKIKSGRL